MSSVDSSDYVSCAICDRDITALSVTMRNAHSEQCLDSIDDAPPKPPRSPKPPIPPKQQNVFMRPDNLQTLDRLDDCPVCGSAWTLQGSTRAAHVRACAKQLGVSGADLDSLLEMFRESLDSQSGSATSATSHSLCRTGQNRRASNGTTSDSCSSGRLFLNAFSPQTKRPSTASGEKSAASNAKSKPSKLRSKSPKQLITGWVNKSHPADRTTTLGKSQKDADSRIRSKCSSPALSTHSSISFEIPEDDDFQSTKVRVALQQTHIAVTRTSKKRQEVLDELDDDLNEAKALSLSLKRGSDLELRGPSLKRRDTGSRSAVQLEKSDILASEEAHSFIRQRALALERMDEELERRTQASGYMSPSANSVRSENSRTDDLRLWDLGSQGSNVGDRYTYCPIFENFKMDHTKHTDMDGCISEVVDHLVNVLAASNATSNQEALSTSALTKESSLRAAYLTVIKAARESFERQRRLIRCSEWVSEARTSTVDDPESMDPAIISLSSSTSSLPPSIPAFEPESRADASANDGTSVVEPNISEAENKDSGVKSRQRKPKADRCPQYNKMSIDDLKRIASDFGLRVNTPRRLIEHQLRVIWEQTHPQVTQQNGNVNTPGEGESGSSNNPPIPDSLAAHLREFIRNKPDIYEQILCYRVLDFNEVYQIISAVVPCTKSILRRFFDGEGVVYTSFQS